MLQSQDKRVSIYQPEQPGLRKPQIVSEKSARYSREHVGNDFIGWLHFQTIYDHLVATQPDMFE